MKLRRLFGRDDVPPDDDDDDGGGLSDETTGADLDEMAGDGPDGRSRDAATLDEGDRVTGHVSGIDAPDVVEAGGVHEDEGAADGADLDDGDEDADDDTDDDGELSGQVEFELSDWGSRERKMLDEDLTALRVRKAWEASTLVVAAVDADVVDDLIDEIEERTALDLAPDAVPVVYDVNDWPAGLEDRFLEALIEQRIAHSRGYREITVAVDDEERVDALVDTVTEAWEDEQADDEVGGPDAQEVLSELFVAADRLLHDPSDRAATVRFGDAAEAASAMEVPFGFVEADWTAITDLVDALAELLGEAESGDEDITSAATELRSHLRPLV